jgi:hypothetical protein
LGTKGKLGGKENLEKGLISCLGTISAKSERVNWKHYGEMDIAGRTTAKGRLAKLQCWKAAFREGVEKG